MQKRTNLNGLINSNWMQYAVSRTGVSMPNCFTYSTARISEVVGFNQPLDDVKVRGAGDLWNFHHKNFVKSETPVKGALMIWTGGYQNFGHVANCEDFVLYSGNDPNLKKGHCISASWTQSNYGGPLFEYVTGDPRTMYPGLTFMGYLVHKNLINSENSESIALIEENGVATFRFDGIRARLDGPNGKVIRTYNVGDRMKYDHKYIGNGHRYIVAKEHEHNVFVAVSATESRPKPGTDEQWATFEDVKVEKPKPKPTDLTKNVKAYGIDVSEHNGDIDITPYDFVIIRASAGEMPDKLFKQNVEKCQKLKKPFGVYHYSYALNEQESYAETNYFLDRIKGIKIPLGCWFDMEDADNWKVKHSVLTKEHCTRATEIFCDEVSKRGYYVGVYSTPYWFEHYVETEKPKWYAHWGTNDGTVQYDYSRECVLYQYSANPIDKNVCYVDFKTFESDPSEADVELLQQIIKNAQELIERLG